jgi:hypothetical protein
MDGAGVTHSAGRGIMIHAFELERRGRSQDCSCNFKLYLSNVMVNTCQSMSTTYITGKVSEAELREGFPRKSTPVPVMLKENAVGKSRGQGLAQSVESLRTRIALLDVVKRRYKWSFSWSTFSPPFEDQSVF